MLTAASPSLSTDFARRSRASIAARRTGQSASLVTSRARAASSDAGISGRPARSSNASHVSSNPSGAWSVARRGMAAHNIGAAGASAGPVASAPDSSRSRPLTLETVRALHDRCGARARQCGAIQRGRWSSQACCARPVVPMPSRLHLPDSLGARSFVFRPRSRERLALKTPRRSARRGLARTERVASRRDRHSHRSMIVLR